MSLSDKDKVISELKEKISDLQLQARQHMSPIYAQRLRANGIDYFTHYSKTIVLIELGKDYLTYYPNTDVWIDLQNNQRSGVCGLIKYVNLHKEYGK